jgi:hypothetical protein
MRVVVAWVVVGNVVMLPKQLRVVVIRFRMRCRIERVIQLVVQRVITHFCMSLMLERQRVRIMVLVVYLIALCT